MSLENLSELKDDNNHLNSSSTITAGSNLARKATEELKRYKLRGKHESISCYEAIPGPGSSTQSKFSTEHYHDQHMNNRHLSLSDISRLKDVRNRILSPFINTSTEEDCSLQPNHEATLYEYDENSHRETFKKGYMPIGVDKPSTSNKLGTMSGVFAPVSLSMLSSILFLRVGYIVGNAGLLQTVLLLLIAYVILVSTVLSISAIATNGAVRTGGVYFMISRTLGFEFGGSIGILFWLANIVSSALYIVACTEGLLSSFGEIDGGEEYKSSSTVVWSLLPGSTDSWYAFLYSSVVNFINITICCVGSKMFGRTTVSVFSIVILCSGLTFFSFFSTSIFTTSYVFNQTNIEQCSVLVLDDKTNTLTSQIDNSVVVINDTRLTSLNCTVEVETSFVGLLHGLVDDSKGQSGGGSSTLDIISENMFGRYEYDCSVSDMKRTPINFFIVFGVLFSGVTGIMSGANISGELHSPSKSIPSGTLSACGFTFSILLVMSILTAFTCEPTLLLHNCNYLSTFSFWSPIVAIGTLLATFSASLNNLIGASRVFDAVLRDMFNLDNKACSKILNSSAMGIILTGLLVQIFLVIGSLNKIAQLSSVLFLLSYASVNLACLTSIWASTPNFRPKFRHYSLTSAMFGLLGNLVMMTLVNYIFAIISVLAFISLFLAITFLPLRKQRQQNWGSISQALLFHQLRKYLLHLDSRKDHVKFWRPQIILFVSNPPKALGLINFINLMKKGGLFFMSHIIPCESEKLSETQFQDEYSQWLSLVDRLKIKSFVEITECQKNESIVECFAHMVRICGMGPIKPNTVVLGFHKDHEFCTEDFQIRNGSELIFKNMLSSHSSNIDACQYLQIVQRFIHMNKNVCIGRNFQRFELDKIRKRGGGRDTKLNAFTKLYLDVWLVDIFNVHDHIDICHTEYLFILQLACIIKLKCKWLKIRTFLSSKQQDEIDLLKEMLEVLRICGEVVQFNTEEGVENLNAVIRKQSDNSLALFMNLPLSKVESKKPNAANSYLRQLKTLTENLPPTLLCHGVSTVVYTDL